DLGPRVDESLGCENAHSFAIGGARYRELFARCDLAFEQIAGSVLARHDGDSELARDRSMQPKRSGPHAGRRRRCCRAGGTTCFPKKNFVSPAAAIVQPERDISTSGTKNTAADARGKNSDNRLARLASGTGTRVLSEL